MLNIIAIWPVVHIPSRGIINVMQDENKLEVLLAP